jgi:hypothetical protein
MSNRLVVTATKGRQTHTIIEGQPTTLCGVEPAEVVGVAGEKRSVEMSNGPYEYVLAASCHKCCKR